MSVAPAIYSRLTGDADVSALVDDRVFPGAAPQQITAFPRICYELDAREDAISYQGFNSNLSSQRGTIACICRGNNSYLQAIDLASKVRAALNQQAGTWGE